MIGTKRKSAPNQTDSSPQHKRAATIKTKWDYNEATNNMKNDLDNGHNIQVIKETETIINELQTEIVLMLELQVMAYKREGRYKEELQTAKTIVTHAPYDATGYLFVGRRYANFGYQKHAIDAFKKGLEQVSQTDPGYSILLHENCQAQERLDQKVDFFKQLPYDITCRVIEFIPVSTVMHCSRVSSAWRTLVLNHPVPWRKINIKDILLIEQGLHLCMLLPSISQHVESFHGLPYGGRFQKPLLRILRTKNFSHLHSLKLELNGNLQDFNTEFSSALVNVSNSLKSLDICSIQSVNILNVSLILSICRNLISLKLNLPCMKSVVGPFNLPWSTNLTTIQLHTREEITTVDLQKLLQSSPKIRWLSIQNCDITSLYELVEKYCPNINALTAGVNNIYFRESDKWYTDLDPSDGLQAIAVTNRMAGHGFMGLLEKQCTLLRKLVMEGFTSTNGTQEQSILSNAEWGRISILEFSNIIHFTLSAFALNTIRHHVGGMLKHMPNLETLNLFHIGDKLTSSAFEHIEYMRKLTELHITNCIYNPSDMHQLLNAFAQNKAKSLTLNSLTLMDGSFDVAAMEITGQIKSLKELAILISPRPSGPEVKRFVKNISQLPQLVKLDLNDMDMTPEDLNVLGTSNSLKRVDLWGIGGVTLADVGAAFPSNIHTEFEPPDEDSEDSEDSDI